MRTLAVLALVALQQPEIDLDAEYLALQTGSRLAMVTLIAVDEAGLPVRGTIQCGGVWRKFQDDAELFIEALPFVTDSRGAIVMNPALDDEYIVCWSTKGDLYGRIRVDLDPPTRVQHIHMRRTT
jgi:hypothetical protein